MNRLIKDVKNLTKSSFRARKDNNNNEADNLANKGCAKGTVVYVKREGDYKGFTIKMLEDVKPLITDNRIVRALKKLNEENIQGAVAILNIKDEVRSKGVSYLYSFIKYWLEKNEIEPTKEIINHADIKLDKDGIRYINKRASDEIEESFQIEDTGSTRKGHPVVPDSWIGRVYKNAHEFHKDFNSLEWRKSLPDARFCAIYSMHIKGENIWKTSVVDSKFNYIFDITFDKSSIVKDIPKNRKYLNFTSEKKGVVNKILFCVEKDLTTHNRSVGRNVSVGVLSSILQKCIRRGRKASKTLDITVSGLIDSKPYNLPSLQFIRVSGLRQLLWRLYISAVEDANLFYPADNKDILSMQDIVISALLCNADPDITFSEKYLKKIRDTCFAVQFDDKTHYDWRKGKEVDIANIDYNDTIKNSIGLAVSLMPMMNNDEKMLRKSFNRIKDIDIPKLAKIKDPIKSSRKATDFDTLVSGYDMHPIPKIILMVQGSVAYEGLTTKQIANKIWEESSKYNVRLNNKINDNSFFKILRDVQKSFIVTKEIDVEQYIKKLENRTKKDTLKVSKNIGRTAFLSLFGKKERFGTYEVVIAGDNKNPCKVKKGDRYIEDQKKIDEIQKSFLDQYNVVYKIKDPPFGYEWNFKHNSDGNINLSYDDGYFTVNGKKFKPFDTNIVKKKDRLVIFKNNKMYQELVDKATGLEDYDGGYSFIRKLMEIHKKRLEIGDFRVFNLNFVKNRVWKDVYVKIKYDNVCIIGPVDRSGKKLENAINYRYEGVVWRYIVLLSALFPRTVKDIGNMRFSIDRTSNEYEYMERSIFGLSSETEEFKLDKNPKIVTRLWDHQKKTVDAMVKGFVEDRRGFGDASHVGAGKTLSALSVGVELINKNSRSFNRGVLILLPTTKLYKTWFDEIEKHTKEIDVIYQNESGDLFREGDKIDQSDIKVNSFVVTTLGRMRDHPLSVSWILVIIDECLSVQNRDALQTAEAWRQITVSRFGVVMLSATFFRSRFDKMFYMLKMLDSGLPETKDYLDTILNECMVCFLNENKRAWLTDVTRYDLNKNLREKYDKIKKMNISSEKLYIYLSKMVNENDFVKSFVSKIRELEKDKKNRCLIYAKSKDEADNIAKGLESIGRYPDISKNHTVVSYSEGTYGLNDLVGFNCIVTRPPEPDKLPQMKGRLDRPGQKEKTLKIEYILTKDTIEEAMFLRLEIANHFYKKHIIPLAEFYDIAVGRKQINKKYV